MIDLVCRSVGCVYVCGAARGAPCTSASGARLSDPHTSRRRAALRAVRGKHRGEVCACADMVAIRDGALSIQEIARDGWRDTAMRATLLDPRTAKAWRVAVACACLDKVYGVRAAPVVVGLLRDFPTPIGVLVSRSRLIRDVVTTLGLKSRRCKSIRLASERAVHEPSMLGVGDSYEAQSIRLVVDGDVSFVPDDKVLLAVRARMMTA